MNKTNNERHISVGSGERVIIIIGVLVVILVRKLRGEDDNLLYLHAPRCFPEKRGPKKGDLNCIYNNNNNNNNNNKRKYKRNKLCAVLST